MYQENGSNKLVIFFTDAAARNFAGYKLLQKYDTDRLFIKDNNRNWYNGPIDGLSEDIYDLADNIKKISKKYEQKNIYCIGGSMGAYAAIVVGSLIGAKNILACSPQMFLNVKLPSRMNLRNENYLKVDNAYKIINEYAKDTNIAIFCGSEDILDVYNVYPSSKLPNMKYQCIYGAPHNTMGYLKKLGVLNKILEIFINDGDLSQVPLPIYKFNLNDDIYNTLGKAIKNFNEKKYKDALSDFHVISNTVIGWAPIHSFIANCYLKIGDYTQALNEINEAISINSTNDNYYLTKGLILINLKRYDEAEQAYIIAKTKALNLLPMHDINLGSIKTLKGEYEEAKSILMTVYEENKTNKILLYQLGLLYMKEKSYQESISYFSEAIKLGNNNPNIIKHLCFSTMKLTEHYLLESDFVKADLTASPLLKFEISDISVLQKIASVKVLVGKYDEATNLLKLIQGNTLN